MLTTILIVWVVYAGALSYALSMEGPRREYSTSTPVSLPARVLVVGASGGTGRELVRQALAQGHIVTAFVRKRTRLDIEHARLTVREGDVLDEAAVSAAVEGQDVVLSALGHHKFLYPTSILSRGTRLLLQAMERHGVRRFICQTSLGIGSSAGRLGLYYTAFTIPLVLPWYFWDKTRQERLIRASPIPWVIVRPAVLTNGVPRSSCTHGASVGSFLWTARISRADVAAFMLRQLVDDKYVGQAPGICG